MKVFFTVDTEFHPLDGKWSPANLEAELARDLEGKTPSGEFGTFYQSRRLREFGLRGVFFVEALSGYVVGTEILKRFVQPILADGHEVGLHLHPEWLRRAPGVFSIPGKAGGLMRSYSEDEQTQLISLGVEQLKKCGVDSVKSFRAGSFGADLVMLRALARNGVIADSSHNLARWGRRCEIDGHQMLFQPRVIENVLEFPVACFEDYPGHWRPAQLAATSSRELRAALQRALRREWPAFVIVSHSFEMIKRAAVSAGELSKCDGVIVRRFERMCEFLAAHKDDMPTATFANADIHSLADQPATKPFRGNLLWTTGRLVEQAVRRLTAGG